MVIFHFTPRMGFVPKREVFEETGISVKNIRQDLNLVKIHHLCNG